MEQQDRQAKPGGVTKKNIDWFNENVQKWNTKYTKRTKTRQQHMKQGDGMKDNKTLKIVADKTSHDCLQIKFEQILTKKNVIKTKNNKSSSSRSSKMFQIICDKK